MGVFWNNWAKITKAIYLVILLIISVSGYSQETDALEKLYAISDEIIVIQIVKEESHQRSAFNCSTYIEATVVERLKSKGKSDSLHVNFIRPLECDKNAKRQDDFLEKGKRLFVVFLKINESGQKGALPKRTLYLADTSLGIQPFTNTLVSFIREIDNRGRK